MKALFEDGYKALIIALVVTLLGSLFIQGLYDAVTLMTLLLICGAWPFMTPAFKKPAVVFLLTSLIGLWYWQQPWQVFLEGTHGMINVVAIVIILQTFSIPIELGRYDRALGRLLEKVIRDKNALFRFISLCTHFFGSFMLFGTIPVMMSLFGRTLQKQLKDYEQFTATAISRSYALMSLWAPGAINLLLVQQTTGVPWSTLFIPGAVLGGVGLLTSFVLEQRKTRPDYQPSVSEVCPEQLEDEGGLSQAKKKVMHIAVVIMSMIFLTLLFEMNKDFSSTQRVMLAGILVSSCWILFYRRNPQLKQKFSTYWDSGIIKAVDLAVLFAVMGIFSNVISQSPLLAITPAGLESFGPWSGFLLCAAIPLLIIMASFVGIHPFISIVLVGSAVAYLALPLPKLALAMSLALGGSISYCTSPFAGIVLVLSKYLNRSSIEISFRWNGLFSLIFYGEGILLIGMVYFLTF